MAAFKLVDLSLQSTGILPSPRSGHRCCASDNYLFVFGGYNPVFDRVLFRELWCYNMSLNRWIEMPNSKRTPFECASSTVALVRDNIFVYGGSGYPFGQTNSNKLLVYSLRKKEWFEIIDAASLDQPLAKYGHGMAYSAKHAKLYVHSGTTGRYFTEELHSFDLASLRWSNIEQENCPEGRYRHEMVSDDDRCYALGGSVIEKSFGFNEIPSFNFSTNKWDTVQCYPSKRDGYPLARKAHASVRYNGDIYMCGGQNVETDTPFDDIWRLNLKTLSWSKLKARLPQKCYFHSAAVSPQGCLFIYGGLVSDGETDYRLSKLYKMWLGIPSLIELVWEKLLDSYPNLQYLPSSVLSDIGIPSHIIERLKPLP